MHTHSLARLLKDFRIHPHKIRFGAETLNGYTRRLFEDAWTRYPASEPEQQNSTNETGLKSAFFEPERKDRRSDREIVEIVNESRDCSAVPVQSPREQAFDGSPFELRPSRTVEAI